MPSGRICPLKCSSETKPFGNWKALMATRVFSPQSPSLTSALIVRGFTPTSFVLPTKWFSIT